MMKNMILILVAVGSVGVAVGADELANRYEMVVPKYRDATDEEADEMTNAIVETYSKTKLELIDQLRDRSMPNMGKVRIIYLLGELRALRASTILIKNINLVADRVDPRVKIARWWPYPARQALVKIGPYASGMILSIIGSGKFDQSKIDGYAVVLADIETPRYALMKLQDRLSKSEDEAVQKQYEAVIERVRKIQAGQAGVKAEPNEAVLSGKTPVVTERDGLPAVGFGVIGLIVGAGLGLFIGLRSKKR